MADQAPSAAELSSLKVLSHLFASNRLGFVVKAVLLLTFFNWFSSAGWEWLQWLPWLGGQKPAGIARLILGTVAFPVMLLWLVMQARNARQFIRPRISEHSPNRVRGLVMFLSTLRQDYEERLPKALNEGLDLDGFRQQFDRASWRMPLEAVAYHTPDLELVVVIASAGDGGSFKQLDKFKTLLEQMFADAKFMLVPLEDCFGEKDDKTAFNKGVDFEINPERLARATNAAYEHMRKQGLRPSDILIDITGGLKVPTVVGSAVALAEGRRIQYVSTQDYHVRVYDVSYEL